MKYHSKKSPLSNKETFQTYLSLKNSSQDNDIVNSLQEFHKYLKKLCTQICPQEYKEAFVYQWIFTHKITNKRDYKNYCKANLYAANLSFDRIISKVLKDGLNDVSNRMLKDFICDLKPCIVFFDKNQDYSWLLMNTNSHISNFYGDLASNVFWTGKPGKNPEEKRTLTSSTPFIIRQSIEYKVKRILGIDYILINGKPDIKTMEKCFKAIEKNKILLRTKGFDFNIIKQIYSWTNYYVHGGYRPEPWKTESAIHYLKGLFYTGKTSNNKYLSLYAGIEVFEDDLKTILENTENIIKGKKEKVVEIKWLNSPEVVIIKRK